MYFNHRRQLASCPSAALNILEKFDQDDNQLFNLINRIDNTMPNTGPKQQELFRLLSELSTRDEVSKTVIFISLSISSDSSTRRLKTSLPTPP